MSGFESWTSRFPDKVTATKPHRFTWQTRNKLYKSTSTAFFMLEVISHFFIPISVHLCKFSITFQGQSISHPFPLKQTTLITLQLLTNPPITTHCLTHHISQFFHSFNDSQVTRVGTRRAIWYLASATSFLKVHKFFDKSVAFVTVSCFVTWWTLNYK